MRTGEHPALNLDRMQQQRFGFLELALPQIDFSQMAFDNSAAKMASRVAHDFERLLEIPRGRRVIMVLESKQTQIADNRRGERVSGPKTFH